MKRQQGAVLVFALIVLVLMTMIGVGLVTNSGLSMRMAGNGSERIETSTKVQGAQEGLINNKKIQEQLSNIDDEISADKIKQIVENEKIATFDSNIRISSISNGDVSCQRSSNASSSNLISCRRAEISTTATFGRIDGKMIVTTGIEQEVLTGS